MRILQLGKFYPIRGGVEKVMRDLTEGLSARSIFCDMLCAKLPSDPVDEKDMPAVEEQNQLSIIHLNRPFGRIVAVPALAKKAGTMLSPAMIRYLQKHQKEYAIIHIHHPDPMAALALRLSGFKGPVILHWHSDIVSQKLLLPFYRPLQNWLIRRSTAIVGTTPVYLQQSPHLKLVQQKCIAIPIGIQSLKPGTESVRSIRARFPGKILIFACGRLVPYKGMEYLVEAAATLPDNFHVAIGGNGPLFRQLQTRIQELGLQERVTLLGYVPDEEMSGWFGACDVFVLPSIMKTEAFGIVQIEAMSLGKPVVTTKIPASGVSWVNKDGVSGINVPPQDASALAHAIAEAAKHREQLGAGARNLFLERYQLSTMIDKTLQLYETCIKK